MRRRFDELGISWAQTRRNATTQRSTPLRGDLWISRAVHDASNFEQRIVGLVECKDRNCTIGDRDWLDAVDQGQRKAQRQGLRTFFVTNTDGLTRCYNAASVDEVSIDGQTVTDFQTIAVLIAIQAQVGPGNSQVHLRSFARAVPDTNRFRAALWNLRQIYRSRGMGRGGEEEIIKTTLTFCILKILSERQAIAPLLPGTILLWRDWRRNQADRDIRNTIDDIVGLRQFQHLEGSLEIDERINSEAACRVIDQLSQFSLYGSDFDFFGIIYETFASRNIKRDFGEFYTPRHVVRFMVRNLFRNETNPRALRVCDPACGTGGFLVETFLFLQENYRQAGSLTRAVEQQLKDSTFVGLDTNFRHAIPYARTNMMMAGDGGAHILSTEDSLQEDYSQAFDYVIANVPYGQYAGSADVSHFPYTNRRRFELLFLNKIVQILRPGGRAAVVVPDGLIQNTSNDIYRYRFALDCRIEAIVSLPSFAFQPYTGEKTYIIFFQKKMETNRGSLQQDPIWHYIVDHDGFQEGSKRFPINDDDLTSLTSDQFATITIPRKADFVEMSRFNQDNFYSLSSEQYLRSRAVSEIGEADFSRLVDHGETIVRRALGDA